MSYREILKAALSLPTAKRADLIDKLQESFTDEAALSPEWAAEVKRRSDEIDRGKARLLPGQEFQRRTASIKKRLKTSR